MDTEEYQPIIIGPRYAVKLRDLEDHHFVRITCFMCRNSSVFLPTRFTRRWPSYTNLMMLENYMVCRKCGNRTENRWEIVVKP